MFSQDTGGAMLEFVTRLVKGEVLTEITRFNEDTQKNEKSFVAIEQPVILFFPNGTSQVMSLKDAETKNFIRQPNLLNFDSVNDPNTIAGKWKFAMTDEARKMYWLELEKHVIGICTARGGYPLDASKATYSDQSILFTMPKKGNAA